MPRERLTWVPAIDVPALNARLRRAFELTDGSTRYAIQPVTGSGTAVLSWPFTLVQGTTTGGAVALTLPDPAQHVGYRVDAVRVAGTDPFTVNGSAVTDGAAFIATPSGWQIVR